MYMKYFVLKPKGKQDDPYARASQFAMLAYADAIEHVNKTLAEDLRAWVNSIMEEEEDGG